MKRTDQLFGHYPRYTYHTYIVNLLCYQTQIVFANNASSYQTCRSSKPGHTKACEVNAFTTRSKGGLLTKKVQFYSLLAYEVHLDTEMCGKVSADDVHVVDGSMEGKFRWRSW